MEPTPQWPAITPAPPTTAAPSVIDAEPGADQHPPRHASSLRRRLGAGLAAVVALVAKLKSVLLLLPKIKLLATAGTMFVSLAAYAWLWGWKFGAGVIALIFVHEMGHVIAYRLHGVKASAPMFIPLLGAFVTGPLRNTWDRARISLAGPAVGGISAVVCVILWRATGSDLFRALAYAGFFLNLLNLAPVVPLDGGQATPAMAPQFCLAGSVALLALVFVFKSAVLAIVLLAVAAVSYSRWRQLRATGRQQAAYYDVRPRNRVLVAAVYLSLIALLALGMHGTYVPRTFN
jgi:Zn-dependent protease